MSAPAGQDWTNKKFQPKNSVILKHLGIQDLKFKHGERCRARQRRRIKFIVDVWIDSGRFKSRRYCFSQNRNAAKLCRNVNYADARPLQKVLNLKIPKRKKFKFKRGNCLISWQLDPKSINLQIGEDQKLYPKMIKIKGYAHLVRWFTAGCSKTFFRSFLLQTAICWRLIFRTFQSVWNVWGSNRLGVQNVLGLEKFKIQSVCEAF